MKALLISNELEEKIKIIDIERGDNELQSIYDAIECRTIDFVSLAEISPGKALDFIVDDEGRFNNRFPNWHTVIPFAKRKTRFPLYGKVIVTTTDLASGETIDTDADFAKNLLIERFGFEDEQFEF